MILNLVKGHGTADDESGLEVDDIVAIKGKVLVILLYGKYSIILNVKKLTGVDRSPGCW